MFFFPFIVLQKIVYLLNILLELLLSLVLIMFFDKGLQGNKKWIKK